MAKKAFTYQKTKKETRGPFFIKKGMVSNICLKINKF